MTRRRRDPSAAEGLAVAVACSLALWSLFVVVLWLVWPHG